MFHFAAPLVNGFGVRTLTPGLSRSSQVWMFFGLPLRTMRLTTERETRPFVGVLAQSLATRPALTRRSMSGASENVTTSAGSPASTARLWSPEAPKDSLNVTPLAGLRLLELRDDLVVDDLRGRVGDERELGLRAAGRGGAARARRAAARGVVRAAARSDHQGCGDRGDEQGEGACLHWGVLQSR